MRSISFIICLVKYDVVIVYILYCQCLTLVIIFFNCVVIIKNNTTAFLKNLLKHEAWSFEVKFVVVRVSYSLSTAGALEAQPFWFLGPFKLGFDYLSALHFQVYPEVGRITLSISTMFQIKRKGKRRQNDERCLLQFSPAQFVRYVSFANTDLSFTTTPFPTPRVLVTRLQNTPEAATHVRYVLRRRR